MYSFVHISSINSVTEVVGDLSLSRTELRSRFCDHWRAMYIVLVCSIVLNICHQKPILSHDFIFENSSYFLLCAYLFYQSRYTRDWRFVIMQNRVKNMIILSLESDWYSFGTFIIVKYDKEEPTSYHDIIF